jgi:Predicted nucleic-acid-binding protein implicated in transcription termination
MFDKKNLIRIAKISPNKFCIDHTGKINSRGSYLCKSMECLRKSKKKKGFERSFKSKSICVIYKELEDEFKKIL